MPSILLYCSIFLLILFKKFILLLSKIKYIDQKWQKKKIHLCFLIDSIDQE